MKRIIFALAVVAAACSTVQVELGQRGAVCRDDAQCAPGLACRCVRLRNVDDEGPDVLVEAGVCEEPTFPCGAPPADGGVDAPDPGLDAPSEAAPDGAAEVESDATADGAADGVPDTPDDAMDGG
jgi:hypothetical protein